MNIEYSRFKQRRLKSREKDRSDMIKAREKVFLSKRKQQMEEFFKKTNEKKFERVINEENVNRDNSNIGVDDNVTPEICIRVIDMKASIEKLISAGCKLLSEPIHSLNGNGIYANIRDSNGNVVKLWEKIL